MADESIVEDDVLSMDPDPSPDPAQVTSEPVSTPEPAEPQFSLAEFVKSQGFEPGDFDSDEALAGSLLSKLKEAEAVAAYAQQRPEPEPEPQPEPEPTDEWSWDSHASKHWNVPEKNPAWEAMIANGDVVQNEEGRWVAHPEKKWLSANPEIANMNAWQKAYREHTEQMLSNPAQWMRDVLEPYFDRRYARPDQIQESLQGQQTTEYLNSLERQLAPHLYKNPQLSAEYGSEQFTSNLQEYGQRFFGLMEDFMASGASNVDAAQKALKYAPPPQETQPAEDTPAPASAPAEESKPQTFADDAMRRASHRPASATPPASDSDPKEYSSEEVWSMFSREAAKASA